MQIDTIEETTLDMLAVGSAAAVVGIMSAGAERRRIFDLGILEGTRVEVVGRSPLGDPTAFRIRGAVVALRSEQTRLVRVSPLSDGGAR